jgi:pre-rRNA-processing protein TSR3
MIGTFLSSSGTTNLKRFFLHGMGQVLLIQADAFVYPPTIIVRNPRENPRKCSILPLKGRPDLVFLAYPVKDPPSLDSYIRLAPDGEPLTLADRDQGVLLLDGSWRWAGTMTRDFIDVPPRSLFGYRTAYPRVSKQGTDPEQGLASVEALFLAYHILGRPTARLLDHYHWAAEFLQANGLATSSRMES